MWKRSVRRPASLSAEELKHPSPNNKKKISKHTFLNRRGLQKFPNLNLSVLWNLMRPWKISVLMWSRRPLNPVWSFLKCIKLKVLSSVHQMLMMCFPFADISFRWVFHYLSCQHACSLTESSLSSFMGYVGTLLCLGRSKYWSHFSLLETKGKLKRKTCNCICFNLKHDFRWKSVLFTKSFWDENTALTQNAWPKKNMNKWKFWTHYFAL